MSDTKILIALGTLIEDYALNVFIENGLTGDEAAMVIESVAARFLKQAYRDTIMSMVQKPAAEGTAEDKTAASEGTAESSDKTKETGKQTNEDDKEKLAMLKEFEKSANAQDEKVEETIESGGDECRHTE